MKLLNPQEAHIRVKKDNETLIESNIRLRQYFKNIVQKLNVVKNDYTQDKFTKLRDFDEFVSDLTIKKAKLLKEYSDLEKSIELKKEIYYGLIEKQDKLEEQIYQANQREEKLNLRESFVKQLENKQKLLVK